MMSSYRSKPVRQGFSRRVKEHWHLFQTKAPGLTPREAGKMCISWHLHLNNVNPTDTIILHGMGHPTYCGMLCSVLPSAHPMLYEAHTSLLIQVNLGVLSNIS